MADIAYSHPRFLFAECALGGAERVWVLAEDGNLFRMLQLKGGKWIQKSTTWPAVALCGTVEPAVEIYVVGTGGEVMRGVPTGFAEENLDPQQHRPEKLGMMQEVRFIGGKAHAVGMARQVYRRDPSGWKLLSEAILPKKKTVVGLHSIDGTDGNLLAVGLGGEIWRATGSDWKQIESPTNVSLNRVRMADKGRAYACGQAGVLLEIDAKGARAAADPVKGQNFYGLAWFKKKLYVATQKKIFVLGDDGLSEIDVKLGDGLTSGYLETNGDELWSVGAHHLLRTEDAKKWTLVKCEV